MELNPGICDACGSEKAVGIPGESETFWTLISAIFKDEIENLSELQSTIKLCPTCIFETTLIYSKKEFLLPDAIDGERSSSDDCRFCRDGTKLFKIENSSLLEKIKQYKIVKKKESVLICASCYYAIEAKFNLRQNLTSKLSELRKSTSRDACFVKDSTCSVDNEENRQTPRVSKKLRRKSLIGRNEDSLQTIAVDSSDNESDHNTSESKENLLYKSKSENVIGEKENDFNTSPSESNKKIHHKNGDVSVIISEDEIDRNESLGVDDLISSTPRKSKRKKVDKFKDISTINEIEKKDFGADIILSTKSSDMELKLAEKKRKSGRRLQKRLRRMASLSEEPNPISTETTEIVKSTNDLNKYSRKHTVSKSTEVDQAHVAKLKKRKWMLDASRTTEVNGFNLSKILQFIPLCKTNAKWNETIQEDPKFYKSIPFVKVPLICRTNKSQKRHNIYKDRIGKIVPSRTCESPTGLTKRTPPIKIRLKPEKKVIKVKKLSRSSHKIELPAKPAIIEEMQKKKLVIKIARIHLPIEKKEDFEEINVSKTDLSVADVSVIESEGHSVLKSSLTSEASPKKKKRVHFNDTPTIIITGDELSDSDSNVEDEDVPRLRRSRRNGKSLKHEEVGKEMKLEGDEINQSATQDNQEVEDPEIENEIGDVTVEVPKVAAAADAIELNDECDDTEHTSEQNKIEKSRETENENDETNGPKDEVTKGTEEDVNDLTEESEHKDNETRGDVLGENKNESELQGSTQVENELEDNQTEGNDIQLKEKNCEIEEDIVKSKENRRQESMNDEKLNDNEHDNTKKDEEDYQFMELNSEDESEDECVLLGDENDKLSVDGLEVVDKCSSEEGNDQDEVSIVPNGNEITREENEDSSKIVDVDESDKVDETDQDKIVLNDMNSSESTTSREDFGSLIDEVQKCLTSSKDLSTESSDEVELELQGLTDEISKHETSSSKEILFDDKEIGTSTPDTKLKRKRTERDHSFGSPEAKKLTLGSILE